MSVVGIAAGIARTVEEDTGFDPAAVTPGVVGFLVTAVFALAEAVTLLAVVAAFDALGLNPGGS